MAQQVNLLEGPDPCETTDLHFKQYCKLKIFDSSFKHEGGNCSLVAVSQYYGLIFIGIPNGFSILKSKLINSSTDFEKYSKKEIILNMKPTHISVDFSQKILAVVCNSKSGLILTFYNIKSLSSKDLPSPLRVISLSKLVSNLTTEVLDITWQPVLDGALVACMSDGSVLSFSNKNASASGLIASLPHTAQATCFCWSPKGKQIVIGNTSGTLSQYKPDLSLVKTIPAPPLFDGNVIVIGVLWISNYQFAVAYSSRDNPDLFPVITIVNATKNEPVKVVNYDDITYSTIFYRNHQLYMSCQSSWNLIFVSSANSIEVAVLHSKDNSSWVQWLLGDASRAELPLDSNRQETFPLGVAFDYTSQEIIPWGEGSLPPMPHIMMLSDEGVLSIFSIVNTSQNVPQLCEPPKEEVDDCLFMSEAPDASTVLKQQNLVQVTQNEQHNPNQISQAITIQSQSLFENSKLNFGSNTSFGGLGIGPVTPVQSQPQVSITFQGGTVGGGPKNNSLIFQPPQQTLQQIQIQQQIQQPQKPATTQMAQTTVSPSALKFTTSAPQFSTPTFTFETSNSTSLYGNKGFSGNTISVSPQTAIFKTKPAAQADIFTGKSNILQSTPIKHPETSDKTSKVTSVKKMEDSLDSFGKTEEKNPNDSPGRGTPELATVDDSVYLNALQDEIDHFNSELKHLSVKVNDLNIQIGTREDKVKMQTTLDSMDDFMMDLKETTVSQTNEIHSVVVDLMESFAWLEDAKSRNLQRKNPGLIELKKSQELDPISTRHMADIAHLKYYIENQLKQLNDHLEKEWMDHQDNYRMEVKNQMAVPPLEEVYKTMHFQLKILNKQRILVEDLKNKMEAKKRKNKSNKSLIMDSNLIFTDSQSTKRTELSKLADNLLQLRISNESNLSKLENWEIMKAQFKAICDRSKKLTSEKQAVLRDILSERDMVKIRPTKTTFESSSFLRSIALEKSIKKMSKLKSEVKVKELKEKESTSTSFSVKSTIENSPQKTAEVTFPKIKSPPLEVQGKTKMNNPEIVFVFGQDTEKPSIPVTLPQLVRPLNKSEEKCPLASLSGIVSSIGKENEQKAQLTSTFSFGVPKSQTPDASKSSVAFGSFNVKPQPKPEEIKTLPTFSFGVAKSAEPVFGNKTEPPKSEVNLNFNFTAPTSATSSPTQIKFTNPTTVNSSIGTASTTTSTPSFNFNFIKSGTPISTTLPKTNVSFGEKQQNTTFETSPCFGNSSSKLEGASESSIFGNSKIFDGTTNKVASTTAESSPYFSMFGAPKTTADGVESPTTFTFSLPSENKTLTSSEGLTSDSSKLIPAKEETENQKKSESTIEAKKELSKTGSPSPSTVFSVSNSDKSVVESTSASLLISSLSSSSTPLFNVQVTSPSQNTVTTTTSIFTKPVVATTTETPVIPSSIVTTQSSKTSAEIPMTSTFVNSGLTKISTAVPTTSIFTIATTSSLAFGQSQASTSITSTPVSSVASIFDLNQKTTTKNVFGQVSSTTPTVSTTNIFNNNTTPSSSTTSIFGATTPTSKPVFGQVSSSTTPTSGSIFAGTTPSTPTTNIFAQVSTPISSPSVFGRSPDIVNQTANIFGQLLSDTNKPGSVFGTTSTSPVTTATNIFNTPKNIFGGTSTTTASIFGTTTPSIFPQTTSVFGQTTTSSSIFGQSQTPTSNTFFGQNICSPFGGNSSVTSSQSTFESGGVFGSKPVFGQSLFGQTTSSNTSIFGGSSSTSIFGGSSTSSAGGNVFQTPTTSTFGSTSPGPFSSGQGSVAQAGFGAANAFQKPLGGFGSPPVFGGAPTTGFGVSPTFGSSTSFGSLPTFGRPFESSQGSFSPPQGHSTTFENLANQSTLGFGNLAQQSQNQGFGVGGFGSSPAFDNKSAFGKKSFSSWRSS